VAAVHDLQYGHVLAEGQVWQQLGGEQEALRGAGPVGQGGGGGKGM
jgi:hypothetical protein